jgi:hypothetical protein
MRRSSSSDSCPRRLPLVSVGSAIATVTLLVFGPAGAPAATARAARTIFLSETGHLRLTSHHGFTLNEQGTASGAIKGKIYIHLNIVATNRVTAEVNIYPSGGSISGYAQAAYRVAGPTASFSGSFSVRRGTGVYRRAHGSGLRFTGTIQRSNDAVVVHLSGSMSY